MSIAETRWPVFVQRLRSAWQSANAALFPEVQIHARQLTLPAQVVIVVAVAAAGAIAARLLPPGGMIGFDWVVYFSRGFVEPIYPPWGSQVVALLTWESLVGLSLAGVTLAVLKRAIHPASAALALLTLPLFWSVLIGQLEGLITLGLTALPWLTPLALLKPQVSTFAFLARRTYLLAFLVWIGLSLLIWGPWPIQMLGIRSYIAEVRLIIDVTLFPWGLPLAALLLWLSRGDMDMLMLAGAAATPYLLPYNLLPVVPAIARLRPRAAIIASVLSWLPLSANWLGPVGWWLCWAFIGYLWLALAVQRYPRFAPRAWWQRLRAEQAHLRGDAVDA